MKYKIGLFLGIAIIAAAVQLLLIHNWSPAKHHPKVSGATTTNDQGALITTINKRFQDLSDENAKLQTDLDRAKFVLDFPRDLKRGSSGIDVKALQSDLNQLPEMSATIPESGYFGRATAAALRNFQQNQQLKSSGVLDRNTKEKLAEVLVPDVEPEPVDLTDELQNLLDSQQDSNTVADNAPTDQPTDQTSTPNDTTSTPDTTTSAPAPTTSSTPQVPSNAKVVISLSQTSFTFSGTMGSPAPKSQTLTLKDTGNWPLNWTAMPPAGKTGTWCSISPASGVLAAGASQSLALSVVAPTAVGTFTDCGINITDPNATNNPQTISVTYKVSPGPCPSGSVTLSSSSVQVGQSVTAYVPSGFSGGIFASNNNNAKVSGSTVTGVSAGNSSISGSGWTYAANGAAGCTLSSANLSIK